MITTELSTSRFEASVLGLRYHRVLADHVDRELTAPLKMNYDYSFVVSYGAFDDPDYAPVRKHSLLIDLTGGMDRVFAGFNSTSRKHCRRADRIGSLQFHATHPDFAALYRFHSECERERGWFPVPESELRNSLVISATFDDEMISAMSCYRTGDRLRLGRIFSKRSSLAKSDLPAQITGIAAKKIVAKFCQYGSEEGCSTLDLGGIDVYDPAKQGITNFKRSFGGEIVPVTIGRYVSAAFEAKKGLIREIGLDVT